MLCMHMLYVHICAFRLPVAMCGYAWASQNFYFNFCLEFIQIYNMLKKNILPILRSKSLLSSASKHTKVGILQS